MVLHSAPGCSLCLEGALAVCTGCWDPLQGCFVCFTSSTRPVCCYDSPSLGAAALKNPQWWGASRSTGKPINEEALLKRKARLAAAVERHGTCIQEVQLQLVKARASEEGRGAGAADARRWKGLQAAPEARGLLTTVFRCASQYRAQAAEQALTVTELSEEVRPWCLAWSMV